MADLPPRTSIVDDRFKLVHSHPDPRKIDEYVFPERFPRMRPYLDEYNGLVLGHTHIQHKAVVDNRIIVNPGSVGQPWDGNPGAAYAVLDTDELCVELHRVSYDIDEVISRVEELGLPTETGTRLLDGS
jgi:diadenosine tetraphosphatase ApaH/serine/threonine PP2A family protein phosphatase